MYKQGSTSSSSSSSGSSSKPEPEAKVDQPMCEQHGEEKINIYCVTCGVPTCSLCKVFGAHKDCEVAPLDNVFKKQKSELTDCIGMLVGNNERIQAIITQLEETCRTVDENGRRQKSKLCETFDHLYALLEEKKGDMTLKINAEQEEKLDYIRTLRRKYTEHLESMAKMVETGIQTMDESEMALFLQTAKPLIQKLVEGTNTTHLDKVERGYEKMDHFTANFEQQRRALLSVDFFKEDEDDFEDSEEDIAELRGTTDGSRAGTPHAAVGAVVFPPRQSQPAGASPLPTFQLPLLLPQAPSPRPLLLPQAPSPRPLLLPQAPSPKPPTMGQAPQAASSLSTGNPTQASTDPDIDDKDGPRHVFSFSWLNQQK